MPKIDMVREKTYDMVAEGIRAVAEKWEYEVRGRCKEGIVLANPYTDENVVVRVIKKQKYIENSEIEKITTYEEKVEWEI